MTAVIKSIRVESLRGIRSGVLEGFSPLTVLVGANGCGKSTLLDAIMIAAGGAPGDAVGRVVKRRVELKGGARWLFWRGGRTLKPWSRIQVDLDDASSREAVLRLMPDVSRKNEDKLLSQRAPAPYTEIETKLMSGAHTLTTLTAIAYDNFYTFEENDDREVKQVLPVRLVDPRPGGVHQALSRSYSDAAEAGLLTEVTDILKVVVPGLTGVLNLSDDANYGLVHIVFADHSVPVAVAGDGVQTLVQVCFSLAQMPGSTVLLEEPEATQHPRSIYQCAAAISAAVLRGVQVILSTHSLELIDGLRATLADSLPMLSVYHLDLSDGEIRSVRYTGHEVAVARDAIGEDLR